MNPPKVDDLDYIHFLIAAQKVFTCTEAARSQPDDEGEAEPLLRFLGARCLHALAAKTASSAGVPACRGAVAGSQIVRGP